MPPKSKAKRNNSIINGSEEPEKSDIINLSSSDEEGDNSKMAVAARATLAKKMKKQDKEFANKLNYLKAEPSHWQDQRNRYLREFYNYVESNRDKFPCVQGDSLFGQAVRVREEQQQLTKGYIRAIAGFRDTSFVKYPVLYVINRTTKWEDQLFTGGFGDGQPPRVKTTHLNLVDGDGNQMLGRLSTEIADQGRQLDEGDIIRHDLFTELTHCVNKNSEKMPFIFVL